MVDVMTAKDIAAKDIAERLRAATWPVHERLHLHPVLRPLTARHPTLDGYLGAIRALYGFVEPMERRLGNEAAGRAARTPLLLADIGVLDTGVSAEPPLASDLPELSTPAARIGARWVLDGSAHGGRAMLPHLQRALAVSPDHGASYFASAGIDLKAERQSLRDLMERGVITEEDRAAATEAAAATFSALERWLDNVAAPSPAS
jgi:heme oxygenase (biliverdin-IX-beta and delta-forming)